MRSLNDIHVWSRACDLAIGTLKLFASCRDHRFYEQTCRSALTIPAKIAAGYESDSPDSYRRLLVVANGNCAELRTQLHIAKELGFIDGDHSVGLIKDSLEVSALLRGLIA
ncbi:MAG: four helix bundle protein [Proteobacteria bacterium]|nr:four helix bundle protein [Pseudomonadota bacterium]